MSLNVFGVEKNQPFPASKALIGHTMPGKLVKYSVRVANYSDLSRIETVKKKRLDVVKKFPIPSDQKAEPSEMMKRLRELLTKRDPKRLPGYGDPSRRVPSFGALDRDTNLERVRENLAWRNNVAAHD